MAGLSKDGSGYRIRFYDGSGDRKQIRLSGLNKSQANTICTHIEAMNSSRIAALPLSRQTSVWLSKIGDTLYDKLVTVGLCEPRVVGTERSLADVIDHHIARGMTKSGRAAAAHTVTRWKTARHLLVKYFKKRTVESVTVEDAEDFRVWLGKRKVGSAKKPYSENSIRTVMASAKMFCNAAIRRKWITENPFEYENASVEANKERSIYVPREWIQKVLDVCPDHQWKLMIALWRFTGLRKMEVFALHWDHVQWDERLLIVPSSKTAHHKGGDQRAVPIVEILPYLQAVRDQASPDSSVIIDRYSKPLTNLDKPFKQMIESAGLEVWTRPFQNLRASCETDWLDWVGPNSERNSAHVVASWIGHSIQVQAKHYAQVDRHHFDTFNAGVSGPTSGPVDNRT